jgi:hypothetical protein
MLDERKMRESKSNIKGRESDEILLNVIEKYPGLSQYELGKKLKWNAGRVDGSIRRLLNAGRIFVRVLERSGRRVNLVYPKDEKPLNLIEVPAELLHKANPNWSEHAFVYALDNSTIGISDREMPEWEETSCFLDKIPIKETDGRMIVQIPEKFWRFYNLERKHRVVSVNGNTLLITVSGDIVEEKKYPS